MTVVYSKMYELLYLFQLLPLFVKGADIYVVGISNQNSERETKGDVVNININNYCPENALTIVKECFCVETAKCNDNITQVQKGNRVIGAMVQKCGNNQVCCNNISTAEVISPAPNPTTIATTTTPLETTTMPTTTARPETSTTQRSEVRTEIITSVTIVEVTDPPSLITTTTESTEMTTATAPSEVSVEEQVSETLVMEKTTTEAPITIGSTTVGITITSETSSRTSEILVTEEKTTTEKLASTVSTTSATIGGKTTRTSYEVELITITPPLVRLCGTRRIFIIGSSAKIVTPTSSPSQVGEFPWTTGIFEKVNDGKLKMKCVGTLAKPDVVLTTASCLEGGNPEVFVVRAGSINPFKKGIQARLWQQQGVLKIVRHPNYSLKDDQNDVALVFLQYDFVLNDYVNVICLPQPNILIQPMWCVSAGWINNTGNLHKIDARLEEETACKASMDKLRRRGSSYRDGGGRRFVCAVSKSVPASQSFCGDALVCQLPGEQTFTQVGLGLSCGQRNNNVRRGVYLNVVDLADWINSHLSLK